MSSLENMDIPKDCENYDWRVGPCAGMTWLEWAKMQIGEELIQDQHLDNPKEEHLDNPEAEHLDNPKEEHLDNYDNKFQLEEDELICPPTPRASHTSTKRTVFHSPKKVQSAGHSPMLITPEKKAVVSSAIPTPRCPSPPRKAKTRAERRAVDLDIEVTETEAMPNTSKAKERRAEYWALQDDLRIKRSKREKAIRNAEDCLTDGTYQFAPLFLGKNWDEDYYEMMVKSN